MLSLSGLSHPVMGLMMPVILAQDTAAPEFSAGQLGLSLVSYAVAAFFCMKIYEKCGVENPWFAWIPILGTYANFQAGDEESPLLWTILMFVPCVNIVAIVKLIISWVRICTKIEKSPWLLLLCLIPIVNWLVLGYFAFG